MIPHAMILKFILPKVLDHLMKTFKLDKMLDYVELPNDADRKIEALEKEVQKLKDVSHPPVIDIDRIEKIENKLKLIDIVESVEVIDDGQAGDA